MALWDNPRWFSDKKRQEQLDDKIRATGKARFGIHEFDEDKKVHAVRIHFNRVAPKYDFMNSLLSFGIQHAWKRAAVRMLAVRRGDKVLDVCGGTGDLAILAAQRTGPACPPSTYCSGRPLVEWVATALGSVTDHLIVLGRSGTLAGIECVPDDYPARRGPLAGLATALRIAKGEPVLLVAVDQPWVRSETLAALLEQAGPLHAVVPIDRGARQVTCGIYPGAWAERAAAASADCALRKNCWSFGDRTSAG